MASLENRILQLEHLLKQKDTEINALKKQIEESSKAPEPSKPKTKRKAPTKECPDCAQQVYAIWHKRHVAECTTDNPSTKGVVKDA